jgi:hypothetical protein
MQAEMRVKHFCYPLFDLQNVRNTMAELEFGGCWSGYKGVAIKDIVQCRMAATVLSFTIHTKAHFIRKPLI